MTIPGFNAQASLYKTSCSYYLAGPLDLSAGTVQPALHPDPCLQGCGDDPACMDCCYCLRSGGDPEECCW